MFSENFDSASLGQTNLNVMHVIQALLHMNAHYDTQDVRFLKQKLWGPETSRKSSATRPRNTVLSTVAQRWVVTLVRLAAGQPLVARRAPAQRPRHLQQHLLPDGLWAGGRPGRGAAGGGDLTPATRETISKLQEAKHRSNHDKLVEDALESLTPEDLDPSVFVNIQEAMNRAPYHVMEATPAQKVHRLFRTMGLRHLVVLDEEHCVAGLITRADLLAASGGGCSYAPMLL